MAVHKFLKLVEEFPQALNQEILLTLSFFLLYVPRFKKEILLTQASNWPANEAPLFLPESVIILLSKLCDIDQKSVENEWLYLKDVVWGYTERAKVVDERFKSHGKELSFSTLCFRYHFLKIY